MRAKIIFSLIICLLMVSSSFAEQRSRPQFEIEIVSTDSTDPYGVIQGTTVSVPIIVNKATHKISGFDFCIEYDPRALILLDVQPGSFLTQNNWEQFGYEFQLDSGIIVDTINPVQVVAIWGSIEKINFTTPPVNINSGDTLAVMKFYVSHDLTLECQSIPVKFYFNDCTDNIVYSWPAEKVYYPREVFSFDDSLIFDFNSESSFNSDCIYPDSDRGRGFNKRSINYKNGRVKFICISEIEDWSYGDINLNGIAYEPVDAVIFTNYFMEGLYAFTVDVAAQSRATDINNDGIPLTLEDLVYLIRIIVGNNLPIDQVASMLFKGNLKIRANETKITVNSKFEIDAGAVHLCFYAPGQITNVVLSDAMSHMSIGHTVSNDSLKILIYSFGELFFGNEKLSIPADLTELVSFEYTGEKPTLAYASAAVYYGEKIDLQTMENSPFSIKIGKVKEVMGGTEVSLPVIKLSGNSEMYGFDFLISYNTNAMLFKGVSENSELFDIPGEYEWEYFTYSFDNDRPCDSGCPSGLLRFVGTANQKSNSHTPQSLYIPDNTTLFTLDFIVSNDMTLMGEFLPVSFFWKDCTDNAIRCKGVPGNRFETRSQIALSNRVFDVESRYDNIFYEITDKNCGFPTLNGAQEECYGRVNSQRLDYIPYINFYNGGIKLIDCGCVDDRGDINLNGIAYEIVDAMLFVSYFIYGPEVFAINVNGQTSATDVNGDAIPLTIEDLVHFIRIIVGDALAYGAPRPSEHFSGTLNIENDENSITVSGEFEKAVGAIHLCFYAPGQIDDVYLTDAANHMFLMYAHKNDSLKIIIFSLEHISLSTDYKDIVNVKYSGAEPVLAYASAGGHKSEKVELTLDYMTDSPVEATLPIEFELSQNFPNPFNPNTEIKFALPRSSDVTLDIFDITGRKVVTLIDNKLSSGPHAITWNGRDKSGREVSTGIYLYRISTEKYSDTKKMLLSK